MDIDTTIASQQRATNIFVHVGLDGSGYYAMAIKFVTRIGKISELRSLGVRVYNLPADSTYQMAIQRGSWPGRHNFTGHWPYDSADASILLPASEVASQVLRSWWAGGNLGWPFGPVHGGGSGGPNPAFSAADSAYYEFPQEDLGVTRQIEVSVSPEFIYPTAVPTGASRRVLFTALTRLTATGTVTETPIDSETLFVTINSARYVSIRIWWPDATSFVGVTEVDVSIRLIV